MSYPCYWNGYHARHSQPVNPNCYQYVDSDGASCAACYYDYYGYYRDSSTPGRIYNDVWFPGYSDPAPLQEPQDVVPSGDFTGVVEFEGGNGGHDLPPAATSSYDTPAATSYQNPATASSSGWYQSPATGASYSSTQVSRGPYASSTIPASDQYLPSPLDDPQSQYHYQPSSSAPSSGYHPAGPDSQQPSMLDPPAAASQPIGQERVALVNKFTSCDQCRKKRCKCDKGHPCERCVNDKDVCTWTPKTLTREKIPPSCNRCIEVHRRCDRAQPYCKPCAEEFNLDLNTYTGQECTYNWETEGVKRRPTADPAAKPHSKKFRK
jgi:hypothetical protein